MGEKCKPPAAITEARQPGFGPRESGAIHLGPMRLALSLMIGLAFLAPSSAHADIYQCRRSDGSLHFTNKATSKRGCRIIVRDSKKKRAPSTTKKPKSASRSSKPFDPIIREAARLYQLPETFIRAVMKVESNFNPDVVSKAGAMGLMQLMPATARSMGVENPFSPRQNILGGARYLRLLANRFNGDLILTVAAYNAGEGAVQRYKGVPPYDETQRYVRRVLKHYYAYRSSS